MLYWKNIVHLVGHKTSVGVSFLRKDSLCKNWHPLRRSREYRNDISCVGLFVYSICTSGALLTVVHFGPSVVPSTGASVSSSWTCRSVVFFAPFLGAVGVKLQGFGSQDAKYIYQAVTAPDDALRT
jgi:hypothetical protein